MVCRRAFPISSSISYQHTYLFTSTVIFVSANGNSSPQAIIFHQQGPSEPPTLSSYHCSGSGHRAHAPRTPPGAVRARQISHRSASARTLQRPPFGLPDHVRGLFLLKGHQNPGPKDERLNEHLQDLCAGWEEDRVRCTNYWSNSAWAQTRNWKKAKRTRINSKLMMMAVRATKKKLDLIFDG